MNYTVWLANPVRLHFSWQALCEAVQNYYAPVVAGNRDFSGVCVRSTMSAPAMQPGAVLVYVLPHATNSVVGPLFRRSPGEGGLTGWNSRDDLTASEVYIGSYALQVLAALIFHEALHNTLHIDDTLHQSGGLAGSPVDVHLRRSDIMLMRRGLRHSYPQWLGGFDADQDPLRGL